MPKFENWETCQLAPVSPTYSIFMYDWSLLSIFYLICDLRLVFDDNGGALSLQEGQFTRQWIQLKKQARFVIIYCSGHSLYFTFDGGSNCGVFIRPRWKNSQSAGRERGARCARAATRLHLRVTPSVDVGAVIVNYCPTNYLHLPGRFTLLDLPLFRFDVLLLGWVLVWSTYVYLQGFVLNNFPFLN